MGFFVGTSGWSYSWNPDGFKWYVNYSGLNAVELNSSFYRYPYPSYVVGWARRTKVAGIRWAVKVNRLITHTYMLSDRAVRWWVRFKELFKPLDPYIDFYLFQLPPRARPTSAFIERAESFFKEACLGWRASIEWRNPEWFNEEWVRWAVKNELTVVSIDSPDFIFYTRSGPYTYVRMHGRTFWYSHRYTDEELEWVVRKFLELNGESTYVFFNNNHSMLDNARKLLSILSSMGGQREGR